MLGKHEGKKNPIYEVLFHSSRCILVNFYQYLVNLDIRIRLKKVPIGL